MALVQKHTAKTKMQGLLDLRQAVWLDYLSRGMTRSGDLQALIDDGLRGMTSNPTIFEHAIGGTADYDDELTKLASSPKTDREVFETLAIEDALTNGGIDFADVNHTLEQEGIERFIKSFDALLDLIAKKRGALLRQSHSYA